jgi:hypothetical protein
MRRILEYDLYQNSSNRRILLAEEFKAEGNPKWPTNWKEMDLWKELEEMGFEDVTTPIQAKNGTIMVVNREVPYMYPSGVVLQSSGYIRDKGVSSGFIKQYKTAFTLEDLFNYLKDRWSKEMKRMNPEATGTLTKEDILLINKSTKAPWKWNPNTNSVDVEGAVKLDIYNNDNNPIGFKFGKIKGEFSIDVIGRDIYSIEDFAPSSVKKISVWGGIKSTKGFPAGIKGGINIGTAELESLKDLNLSFGAEYLMTRFFDIKPFDVETCLKVLELGSVKTYYKVGGGYNILPNHDAKPGYDDKARSLVTTILSNEILDSYFKRNPLKITILDAYPDTKEGVLKRTGMRDLSKVSKGLQGGWFN